MNELQLAQARMFAEVLRIQRWAGGDSVDAGRIFGLMTGFESVIRHEEASAWISNETQQKVERLLADVDDDKQSPVWMHIKDRLHREGIDETDATSVMQLCQLQGRFGVALEMIAKAEGSSPTLTDRMPEQDWLGALHYMELVDCTKGVRQKMHAVYAPAIPRVGEFVTPQVGSAMVVVWVDHVVCTQGKRQGLSNPILIPHIGLKMADDGGGDDDDKMTCPQAPARMKSISTTI